MSTAEFDDLVRRLPKVELHSHLEGSVRPKTLIELARKNDVPLPSYDVGMVYPDGYDPDRFFTSFFAACEVIATPDDCSRVIYEAISDAVESGNVRYTEMFFQPTMHPRMTYPQMVEGLVDGIRAAETDTRARCGIIPAINRGQGAAVACQLVDEILEHRHDAILGVGLDGDNFIGPAEAFVEAYRRAAEGGLRRTAHAGLPLTDTDVALDLLGCERIDHGYLVTDDPQLLHRAVEERIHFTACWTLCSHYCPTDRERSPIQRMVDAGMSVSINTDDPQIFHTDIGREHVETARTLGWDLATVWQRISDALDAAWLDENERSQLRRSLDDEAAAVLGDRPNTLRAPTQQGPPDGG